MFWSYRKMNNYRFYLNCSIYVSSAKILFCTQTLWTNSKWCQSDMHIQSPLGYKTCFTSRKTGLHNGLHSYKCFSRLCSQTIQTPSPERALLLFYSWQMHVIAFFTKVLQTSMWQKSSDSILKTSVYLWKAYILYPCFKLS